MGIHVSDKIKSGLFDWSRSSDRNRLASYTQDDVMLYDTGCGYDNMDCLCKVA